MQAEKQLINRVLQTGRVRQAIQAGVVPEMFHRHKQEWTYIVKHYMTHSEAPDVKVFCDRYPDYTYKQSAKKTIRVKPAVEAVVDNHIAIELARALKTSTESLDEKPAVEILEELQVMIQNISRVQSGDQDVNVITSVEDDIAEFMRLRHAQENQDEHAVVPTPWAGYNEIWGGWNNGGLTGVLARMNEGKSWLLDQGAVYAALSGFRPYLAPLEMTRFETVARLHTIASFYLARKKGKRRTAPQLPTILDHKSLHAALAGKPIFRNRMLLMGHNDIDVEEYKKFAMSLQEFMPKGIVLPDLNMRSEAFTSDTFIKKVERSEADIAFLDYAGLLQNVPRGQQRWEMWANISRDLKMAAQYLDIPIVVALQAARTGAMNKTPELEDIADSDSWGRDCDRIISVRQSENKMLLTNIKSRQSERNWRITCDFYPDYGIIEQDRNIGIERDVL